MSALSLFSGKVVKQTLPVFHGPSAASKTVTPKRLMLPQGELAQMYDADEPVRYIAYIESIPGGVRGNHYHKIKVEFVYIIRGEQELLVQDPETKARETILLKTGDLVMIQPHIGHALRPLKPGLAIEFSKARFDADDVYPCPLTE